MVKNVFLLGSLLLIVAACGVKPSSVETPPGSEGSSFPHTYPSE